MTNSQIPNSKSVVILGAGAWGTTLAKLAAINGNQVHLWSRQEPLEKILENNNPQIILSAISMKGVRDVASIVQSFPLAPQTIFVRNQRTRTTHYIHTFANLASSFS